MNIQEQDRVCIYKLIIKKPVFGHEGLKIPPQMGNFTFLLISLAKRFLWRTILKGQPHFVSFFYKNNRASK